MEYYNSKINDILPIVGLGTYNNKDKVELAIKSAVDFGYTHIDTAKIYGNEDIIGSAIKKLGLKREDLFITSKLWRDDMGYKNAFKAINKTLKDLQTDYVDAYLIHWPRSSELDIESYQALEQMHQDGKVKYLGMSNFDKAQMEVILSNCKIKPTLMQIEIHPYLTQKEITKYYKDNGFIVQAYTPVGRGVMFNEPIIVSLCKKYNKTPSQIILRWHVQNGLAVAPKSATPENIKQNISIFDFELDSEELLKIDSLNKFETRLTGFGKPLAF